MGSLFLALAILMAVVPASDDAPEPAVDSLSRSVGDRVVAVSGMTVDIQSDGLYPMSEERRDTLSTYARFTNIWRFFSFFLEVLVLLAFLYTGFSARLRTLAERIARPRAVRYLLYLLFFSVIVFAVHLPFDYYRELMVEHQYGFSNESVGDWFRDSILYEAVWLVFLYIVVLVSYHFINRYKRWWLWLSLVALPFMVFIIVIYPVVITPMFNRFEPLQDEYLAGEMRALATRAGIDNPDILQVNASKQSTKLNAYFTGMLNTQRIVLYDNIIAKMSTDELKYVMGHEIGHYVKRHIWLGLFGEIIILLLGLFLFNKYGPVLVRHHARRFGFSRIGDIASLPLILAFVTVYYFVIQPIPNAVSRYFEYQADEYGYRLSGVDAATARTAFEKLSAYNLSDPSPSPFIEFWFYDHPSTDKRIEHIRSLQTNPTPDTQT
ncbi:MAG: M48 family metallopeptidase [candidate division Zixibacteria bacterium]|nr:M48 family metallopeptidase [candidate division Zixibacteria bacterium]